MTSVTCLEQRIGLGTPADPPRGYAREAVTGVHSVTAVSAPRINVLEARPALDPTATLATPRRCGSAALLRVHRPTRSVGGQACPHSGWRKALPSRGTSLRVMAALTSTGRRGSLDSH